MILPCLGTHGATKTAGRSSKRDNQGPTDTWSLFNQRPYTYTNVTSLPVSFRKMCEVWLLKNNANETDKEVTFVYVYGRWLKILQVSVDRKVF